MHSHALDVIALFQRICFDSADTAYELQRLHDESKIVIEYIFWILRIKSYILIVYGSKTENIDFSFKERPLCFLWLISNDICKIVYFLYSSVESIT